MVYQETIRNAVGMILTSLIDIFLPRLCFCCKNKLLPEEKSVCSICISRFKYADSARLTYEYEKDFRTKGYIKDFASYLVFEKDKEIQHLIHSMKYEGRFKAAVYLGGITAEALNETISSWNIDIIIPIPLHRVKQIQRGYNQSYYIARGISRNTGKPLHNKAVIRKKNTLSQTKMDQIQREQNIENAFKLKRPDIVKHKNILLVDDVITTGSTMNECGRVLLEGGAAKVFAISSAVASLKKIEFDPEEETDI
jgi:ComF family protein